MASRSPVFAANLVAASQPLAVQAGLRALMDGGNAVDAALACAIALTVVEPSNNGIGGDVFAIVHDGKSLHGLNASGRAPLGLDRARFDGMAAMPVHGWDAVTLPGGVSGWVALSGKFGKLPFARLFEDAVRYAEAGFAVGPKTAADWQAAAETFTDFAPFMETFTLDARAPAVGERVRLPDHARTLAEIAETKGESFYRGRLAEAMAREAAAAGAPLSGADLASHECEWVAPISAGAFGTQLHEIPPNSQGLMALMALGLAERSPLATLSLDSPDSLHLQIEAMRIAYADMAAHLGDPAAMRLAPAAFLEDAYLSRRAKELDMGRANARPYAMQAGASTVCLATADAGGMMVSLLQSNYMGFGSGIVIPGTGIALHNRGAGFVLEPGHANDLAPGKRPYHTLAPGFVTSGAAPFMSFGVMGGHMQAQGHLQMAVRICLHGQDPQAASDAPRWQLLPDGRVALETGFDARLAESLVKRGHQLKPNAPEALFGGAQLIVKTPSGYVGGSDHRKEGMAAGF